MEHEIRLQYSGGVKTYVALDSGLTFQPGDTLRIVQPYYNAMVTVVKIDGHVIWCQPLAFTDVHIAERDDGAQK